MSSIDRRPAGLPSSIHPSGASLADVLERVLDKGVVIAGDVVVQLLDVELLTLKLRLLIASADTARSMGIDWWERDPSLSSAAPKLESQNGELGDLRARLERIERMLGDGSGGRG